MPIKVANSGILHATRKGVLNLNGVKLPGTYTVPGIKYNLISVSKLTDLGYEVTFTKTTVYVVDKHGKKVPGLLFERTGSLYTAAAEAALGAESHKSQEEQHLWHSRLAHISMGYVAKLLGLKFHRPKCLKTDCTACAISKATKQPFKGRGKVRTQAVLDRVDADLHGPSTVASRKGYRYFAIITDIHSRFSFVSFQRKKSEFFGHFRVWLAFIYNKFQRYPKTFHTDNGGEFVNKIMDAYIASKGIVRTLTSPHNPAQNPFVERMNRKVLESSNAMMVASGVPHGFWPEAVEYAVYILNRLPHKGLDLKTPIQMWEGGGNPMSPEEVLTTLKYIRVFGCLAVYTLPNPPSGGCRGKKGIFMGLDTLKKGYKVWCLETRTMITTPHVVFHEKNFPYVEAKGLRESQGRTTANVGGNVFTDDGDVTYVYETTTPPPPPTHTPPPAPTSIDESAPPSSPTAPPVTPAAPPLPSPPSPPHTPPIGLVRRGA
jgi:hypothetical protein